MMMTGSGPAEMSPGALVQPEPEEINTRFGRITVDPRQQILFPSGLLGMPEKVHYCLARFPSEKMARFKLLQSLEDPSLSFITLPVDITNPLILREDLEQAARDLDIPLSDLAVLLVVTVHRATGAAQLSVNARAPLLIHAGRRVATQFVFPHNRYQIRQALGV
jgi:flagellar assembly factor FliW